MPLVEFNPAAPETGGRTMPKPVAAIRRFRWTTRAEICSCRAFTVLVASIAAIILCAERADACTPVFAIVFPLYGPARFGALVTGIIWIFPGVVLLKYLLFSRFAGYGHVKGSLDMLLGNVVSS